MGDYVGELLIKTWVMISLNFRSKKDKVSFMYLFFIELQLATKILPF